MTSSRRSSRPKICTVAAIVACCETTLENAAQAVRLALAVAAMMDARERFQKVVQRSAQFQS